MSIKSFLKTAIMACLTALLVTSCGSSYYCTLNSRGTIPYEKTYYITSNDPNKNHSLEYKEYAAFLRDRLNEMGYIERKAEDAYLRIEFDYTLGQTYLAGTSSTTDIYSSTYIDKKATSETKQKSSTTSGSFWDSDFFDFDFNSKKKERVSERGTTYGTVTQDVTNEYRIPLYISITAIEKRTGDHVWEVAIKDEMSRETQLQSVMPWALLGAQEFFGRSSRGEQTITIDNDDKIRARYGLVWPYDTW